MKNIKMGIGCYIDPSVIIMDDSNIELGDHVYIGENVKILAGNLRIGDYSKIHNGVYINPKNFITLGHLTWIGQNSILDGTGGLTAGNFLGVGMGSALYSHIRHGDVMEGCLYNKNKELIIGDDVWFVGMCLISPITAESKSMAMLGSVVTKDMIYNNIYGGNPAKNISDKIGVAFKEKSIDEKFNLMKTYINEYELETNKHIFIEIVESYPKITRDECTYYNIADRTYTKRNSKDEILFNKWLFKYKAKFIPI